MRAIRRITFALSSLLVSCLIAGHAGAADLNLSPSNVGFHAPIGIDFQETSGKLVLSADYPTGAPNNLELADPNTGTNAVFSSLSALSNELKIATVRASSCQPTSGFTVGEVFTGNGSPGQIIRINPLGTSVINPWVTLPSETAIVRGSLFQDRFGVAGCNLIAVTGNEQEKGDPGGINDVGNVWRITGAGISTKIATLGKHLEGVTTVPNLPMLHGPMAGKILAGAEDFDDTAGPPTYSASGGRIFVVDPNGIDQWFTISNGLPQTCTPGTASPNHCNYHTATAFHPEDLDVIRRNADFFGVSYSADGTNGAVLTAPAADFANRCGQVLITQEFPLSGTSGLYALRWDGTTNSFTADSLTTSSSVSQWEHVTFTSGSDCDTAITIAKTPDNGTFNVGDTVQWTIVVANAGLVTAQNVTIDDPLPTTGGLTWSVFSTSQGTCSIDASQILHCDLGDLPAGSGGNATVVVRSTSPATVAQCQQLNNTARAAATNAPTVTDPGSQSCTPPGSYSLTKSPKNATYNIGDNVSFSITVSSNGPGPANNVVLNDPLPMLGNLNNWIISADSSGICTIVGNTLNCNYGNLPNGATRSVTVMTNASGGANASACTGQKLNNTATLTGTGLPTKTDTGDYTCTPPSGGGLIAPTQTTCQDYRDGTASALGSVNYPNSGGKIGNGVDPGVFFYYAKITTTVPNQVVTSTQTHTGTGPLFQIHQDQDRLYTLACTQFTSGTEINNLTAASFTIPTPGTYIISIKYNVKSIAGAAVPSPTTITYTFSTSLGPSTSGTVVLTLK